MEPVSLSVFIALYVALGWLFARSVQRYTPSELNPQNAKHAGALLFMFAAWPLCVVFFLVMLSMNVLFPRIKK